MKKTLFVALLIGMLLTALVIVACAAPAPVAQGFAVTATPTTNWNNYQKVNNMENPRDAEINWHNFQKENTMDKPGTN